jgi:Glycosyl hydrolase family 63 C-terminal domain
VSENLLERAHQLLEANTQSAQLNGRRYVFSVPSATKYPFQWFWDSCFHAIVWSRIDVERAKEELRGLLSAQTDDGLLPHVIFWNPDRVSRLGFHHLESAGRLNFFLPGRPPRVSAQMQPPVIAQAVEEIVAVDGVGFLAEVLPALERYFRYLATARDPDRDGLITIVAQFESGLDFSPAYDRPSRGKPVSAERITLRARGPQLLNKLLGYDVGRMLRLNEHQFEDVLVNSVYADGLESLSRLAARAGGAELETWASAQAHQTVTALIGRCYDERQGLFFNLSGRREQRWNEIRTIISLMPLLLSELPAGIADRLVEHLTDPDEFWTAYPVPSVARNEPTFRADSRPDGRRLIWRGPSSINTNWLLARGLRRHGHEALADQIADRSRELVERGGFNEFFDPLTGRPVGAELFGWATLAAAF